MSLPLFPSLTPKLVDPMWFNVDLPCDDESEVTQLEQEHQTWLQSIQNRDSDLTPIGKTVTENLEVDDEEDDDEDDNDDDDTESPDEEDEDEIDMEISYEHYERHSPVDVSIRMVQGHGVR